MRKTKYASWMRTASGFVVGGSILSGVAYGIAYQNEISVILAFVIIFMGVWLSFLMKIIAEILEYLQHITKQLDDLYTKEDLKQRFDKTV